MNHKQFLQALEELECLRKAKPSVSKWFRQIIVGIKLKHIINSTAKYQSKLVAQQTKKLYQDILKSNLS